MFDHNLTFFEDALYLISQVHNVNISLNEVVAGESLGVTTEGIKSLKDWFGSEKFLKHIEKLDYLNIKSVYKKSLKRGVSVDV